jgi:hypothetical protein
MTEPCLPPNLSSDQTDDAVIARALRRSLVVIASIAAAVGFLVFWLNRPQPTAALTSTPFAAPDVRESAADRIPEVTFTDVTRQAGIEFVHCNGAYGDKLLPETMGGGCAFLDYNQDSHQDLLLVNSCHWPGRQPADEPTPRMALFENDGAGRFRDVTAACGLDRMFYGIGVAVGDYDNDGWTDVFVSAVGENHLYHNEQGRFREVTAQAGVAGDADRWSSSCGWLDYNNDGRLDLFVTNYVQWSAAQDLRLERTLDGVNRAYLPPTAFAGTFPYLYRNEGEGRFTDVSAAAEIQVRNPATGVPTAKSLGVVFADLDRDGWMDIVVANDTVQNFVFHNRGNGTFAEVGALAGVAFDTNGQARGAMGIDAARFRNDGQLGLVIANFANEMSALYVSQSDELFFFDEAVATGLGPATRLDLTFGTFFFDYDLDGRLDILAANGHLEEDINKIQQSQHYEQPPQLFWNAGFEELTEFPAVPPEKVGPDFVRPMVGRGTAYADIDGDGDLDVLITSSGGRPRLLRNDQQLGHHWLRFKLIGVRCNRDAVGARVEVHAGGVVFSREVSPTRSYLSQCELPVTVGLGSTAAVDKVVVRWPAGSTQEVPCSGVDRMYTVQQTTGGESLADERL